MLFIAYCPHIDTTVCIKSFSFLVLEKKPCAKKADADERKEKRWLWLCPNGRFMMRRKPCAFLSLLGKEEEGELFFV